MSDVSTKIWKSHVQSKGWTTGACDSITFNAWYDFSSRSILWNGVCVLPHVGALQNPPNIRASGYATKSD